MGKITVETCEIEGLKISYPLRYSGDARRIFEVETYNYNDFVGLVEFEVFVQTSVLLQEGVYWCGLHLETFSQEALVKSDPKRRSLRRAADLRKDPATLAVAVMECLRSEEQRRSSSSLSPERIQHMVFGTVGLR